MRALSRRQFVQVTSAGVLVAACSDDPVAREVVDAPDTFEPPDTTPIDTAEALPDTPDTPEPPDTTPEATPELPPEVDAGPLPIGTFDPATLALAARSVFLYGTQAGDPQSDGAVIWTRFRPSEPEHTLDLLVFEHGTNDVAGELYLRVPATIAEGGFVHVEVAGLAPDTRYRYCFVVVEVENGAPVDEARSPVARFRTSPAADALRVVTFGGTSCVNAGYLPYRTLNRAAEADLDFFVMAGDTTYCDGARTLDEYREKWRRSFDSDGYRAILGSVGTYATWDDHEVDDDWDPERTAPEQLATAKRAYLDHIAFRIQTDIDPLTDWRLWRSYRWGKTLEVFILDCRSERLPSTRFQANAQYISPAQMQWIKLGLRRSPCTFKLIVNTVPITNMPTGYPIEKDRWEGYETQRTEILGHIDGPPLLPGVLWLSGDFHFGCITTVERPGQRFSNQWEVFMGQGANMSNPIWEPLRDTASDQLVFLTGTSNYVKFVCDPFAAPPRITAQFIDGDGTVLHTQDFDFPTS